MLAANSTLNAFVFGRNLKQAVKVISQFSRSNSATVKVTGALHEALMTLGKEIAKTEPVVVKTSITKTWTIYTDGAYEPDGDVEASIGAVLVDDQGMVIECFGMELIDSLRQEFLEDSKHPIYELELFPVLLALRVWQEKLLGSQVVFFLDNDAARSSLIRAEGATRLASAIVNQFVKLESTLKCFPWFARVPSASNPADDASRLVFNVPWLLGVPKPSIVLPARLSQWGV
jgi:hypothetical protein